MPANVRSLGLARLLNPDEFEDPRSNPYADEPVDPPPDAPALPEVDIEVEPPTIRAERPVAPPPEPAPPGRFGMGRMVPMVPGRPAAPAAPEPAPARSPLVPAAGGRSSAEPASPRGDSLLELLQAQRHDSLVRGANSVGDALYGAFTRTKAAPAQGSNMAGEMAARDALADKEAARAKAARLERSAAIDADPTSEASRAAQAMLGELLPGFLPPETISRLSKAQLEKMLPVLKEIEAKRTDRTFQDEQRRKGEGFKAGESKLDRDLEREKFGAQQQVAADKASADKTNRGQDQVEGWRKEMSQRPELKQFRDVQVSFDKVRRSAEMAKRTRSPAADMAMIFGIMKMQDPGSTVREGEYANAQNAGSADERLIAMYNRAKDGTLLTTEMRQDFLNLANELYQSHEDQARTVVDFYRGQAEKNQLNPDDVGAAIGVRAQANGRASRTVDGETRFWDGKSWVKE